MSEKQILELQISQLAKKLEALKKINEEENKLKKSTQVVAPKKSEVAPKKSEVAPKKSEIFDTEDFDEQISKKTSQSRVISNSNEKAEKTRKLIRKLENRKHFNKNISSIQINDDIIIEEDKVSNKPKSKKTDSQPKSKKTDSQPKSKKTDSQPKIKCESKSQKTIQQLKKIAKDFDIKGYTTMSRDELEYSIKIPTITFNAKKLTKWLNSVKDKSVILFGSNGDLGFSIKENTQNIFFADRCHSKDKNFNKINFERFFKGNNDVFEHDNGTIETMKKILKKCETLLFVSRNDENGITFNEKIPKLSEENQDLSNSIEPTIVLESKKSKSKKSESKKSESKKSESKIVKYLLKIKEPCNCGADVTEPFKTEMILSPEELSKELEERFNPKIKKISMFPTPFESIEHVIVKQMLKYTITDEYYEEDDIQIKLFKIINDKKPRENKNRKTIKIDDFVKLIV